MARWRHRGLPSSPARAGASVVPSPWSSVGAGSRSWRRCGTPFFAAYRASKAAMSALCETLLVELAPFGIRVLEVLPGPVATEGLAGSDHIEAVDYEPYREPAERMMASRGRVHELAVTPATAAARIVDAILDDNAPVRFSTDPMGDALL